MKISRSSQLGIASAAGFVVALLVGAAAQPEPEVGRYQLGQPYAEPGTANREVIPILDTTNGDLWIWEAYRADYIDDWDVMKVGSLPHKDAEARN